MRVLLDACLPRKLRTELAGHHVETARHAGLARLDDGPLLAAMTNHFDVLVTMDKSLPFQQAIASRLAVIVLRARNSKLADLLPLVADLLRMLDEVKPGEFREIGD